MPSDVKSGGGRLAGKRVLATAAGHSRWRAKAHMSLQLTSMQKR